MNISVDLAPKQLEFLERMLKTEEYRSRSEIVRDVIRRAEFEWEWKKGIEQASRSGASEDISRERGVAFKKLKKRFGDAL